MKQCFTECVTFAGLIASLLLLNEEASDFLINLINYFYDAQAAGATLFMDLDADEMRLNRIRTLSVIFIV
jgi:hypothetical protein